MRERDISIYSMLPRRTTFTETSSRRNNSKAKTGKVRSLSTFYDSNMSNHALWIYASSIPETAPSRLKLRKDQMLKLRYHSTKTSMAEIFSERRSLPEAANLDKSGSVLNVLGHALIVPPLSKVTHFQSLVMSKDHSNFRCVTSSSSMNLETAS
jgi:hypothetical protein